MNEKTYQGRRVSAWFSAEQLKFMDEAMLSPADIIRYGITAAQQGRMALEPDPDTARALGQLASLVTALANGARLTWPEEDDPGPKDAADHRIEKLRDTAANRDRFYQSS